MTRVETHSTSPEVSVIETQALTRDYRMGHAVVHALQGVTLSIAPGEFVALMGASGCGKSTLLHLLGCLDTPTSGRYLLEGRDVSTLSKREQAAIRGARIGFVFQNFFLLSGLTSLENVRLPLDYSRNWNGRSRSEPTDPMEAPGAGGKLSAREAAAEALAQVGLADRATHHPNELSGGERQRVAIARALVNHPAILLADEPTGNLDSATGLEVMRLLTGLWERGLSILLVTHDPNVAGYAQRTLHMHDGKIIQEERNHAVH